MWGEDREKKGERPGCCVCIRVIFPRTTDWGFERNCGECFTNSGAQILRFWKSMPFARIKPGRQLCSWRGKTEAQEWKADNVARGCPG